MRDFRVMNMTVTGAEYGFIATFNISYYDVVLRGFGLRRVETHPMDARFYLPNLAFGEQRSVTIRAALRDAIGQRAAELYNHMVGANLTYVPPPRPSAANTDDGLAIVHRMIGAPAMA